MLNGIPSFEDTAAVDSWFLRGGYNELPPPPRPFPPSYGHWVVPGPGKNKLHMYGQCPSRWKRFVLRTFLGWEWRERC